MRGVLNWLFGKPHFHQLQDHYALSRDVIHAQLCEGIRARREAGDQVFVLCHFPESFVETQEAIERQGIEYGIVERPIDWRQRLSAHPVEPVSLSLAEAFSAPLTDALERQDEPTISIIVTEFHPLPSRDQELRNFARRIPYPTQLGYYVSLDQPVPKAFIDEMTIKVLKQFGLTQNDLITSDLVSRRLASQLAKLERSKRDWQTADSAEQWLRLNLDLPKD